MKRRMTLWEWCLVAFFFGYLTWYKTNEILQMKHLSKKQGFLLAFIALVVIGFCTLWATNYSISINTSKSMPRGIYLTVPLPSVVVRGDVVSLCVPDFVAAQLYKERNYVPLSSRCRFGIAPLMKPIAGIPGDVVKISADGTYINGSKLHNSKVFDTDSQGLWISHLPIGWQKKLALGEFFMLANHTERSLDSRYYGTVESIDFISKAIPLLTF